MIDFEAFPRARHHFKGSKSKSMVSNYTRLNSDFSSSRLKMLDQHIEQFQFRVDDSTQSQLLLLDVLEFPYFISRKLNFQSTITLSTDFYWKIGRGAALIKC